MSSRVTSFAEAQAIQWMIRARDPAFDDWDGFTAWLEADPAHARLFDELSAADAEIADHLATVPARPVRKSSWLRWGGALVAALVLMALLLPMLTRPGFAPREIASRPGQKLTVRLADGSRIDLNGGTRLILDGPRHARLEKGEALFVVVHDDARPFEVVSGDAVVRDVGTVFNLVREPQTFTATVSEGEIIFNPDREAVRVPAGRQVREAGDEVVVTAVDPAEVGTWRQGRLIYRGARIERIAADLSRGLGMPIAADGNVSARPFSGIIQIEGRGEGALRSAAQILGVDIRRTGDAWLLTAP